jgi:Protein of unknown function
MDAYSDNESSESEEKLMYENVNPTKDDPFPLEVNMNHYMPPLTALKISGTSKTELKFLLGLEIVKEIHLLLFWQVFYKKLKPDTTKSLQEKVLTKLGSNYVKLLIYNMTKKLGNGLEYLPLMLGHAIHHEFFNAFKLSNHIFDIRFVLDCYKIIYQQLLGLTVTDSFILKSTKQIFGEYFMKYTEKATKKTVEPANIFNKKFEKQMESVPGGIEFAKELASKLRPVQSKIEIRAKEEKVKLATSDNVIEERVHRQLSEPLLKKSLIQDKTKSFNCVRLSPLLSTHIQSSTV